MSTPRPLTTAGHFLRWISNPISEDGLAEVFKLQMALGGRDLVRKVEEMRTDPEGRRILDERPHLGLELADESLGALPEGTFGRRYHEFMSAPAAVPNFILAGLVHKDDALANQPWNDDMKYVFERLANAHDVIHVLSGYGTHFGAEALNVNFIIALQLGDERRSRRMATAWAGLTTALLTPTIGVSAWWREALRAYERGLAMTRTKPLHTVHFESRFDQPLEDLRSELGIPPLGAPEPLDTEGWLGNPLARAMAKGFGGGAKVEKKRLAAGIQRLVLDAGVPMPVLVNHDRKLSLIELALGDVTDDELRAAAGVPAAA